jgi:hypothetical protein
MMATYEARIGDVKGEIEFLRGGEAARIADPKDEIGSYAFVQTNA